MRHDLVQDQITGLALRAQSSEKQQDPAQHVSMGNVLMNRWTTLTLGRKHKFADV